MAETDCKHPFVEYRRATRRTDGTWVSRGTCTDCEEEMTHLFPPSDERPKVYEKRGAFVRERRL